MIWVHFHETWRLMSPFPQARHQINVVLSIYQWPFSCPSLHALQCDNKNETMADGHQILSLGLLTEDTHFFQLDICICICIYIYSRHILHVQSKGLTHPYSQATPKWLPRALLFAVLHPN